MKYLILFLLFCGIEEHQIQETPIIIYVQTPDLPSFLQDPIDFPQFP